MPLKSSAEIAQIARDAGHEVSVIERPPPPEFPEGHWKYWASCTCGFKSKNASLARKNATLHAIHHMMSAAADADLAAAERRNGGGIRASFPRTA